VKMLGVYSFSLAGVAQLVEQLTCNQQVVGSTPIASSILFSFRYHFLCCRKWLGDLFAFSRGSRVAKWIRL
jgi:hypothetical protein